MNSYRFDQKLAKLLVLMPLVWLLLWAYQEFTSMDNSMFLAQSASFVFMGMLPVAMWFHLGTIKKLYARSLNHDKKQKTWRHRRRLYLLSFLLPVGLIVYYFNSIFRHTLEQNIVYGAMLLIVAGTIQLVFIDTLSLMLWSAAKEYDLPRVLVKGLSYPIIALPVIQALIYFLLA